MRITELQLGSILTNDYLAADETTHGTRKLLLSDIIALAKAGLVPYDAEIELTSTEKQTARTNIGAIALADLPSGTTSAAGIVQLYNGTDSTSTNLAATAAAVKEAYEHGGGSSVLKVDISSFSSLPQTASDANITSDMELIGYEIGTPSAQTSDWTVTTASGTVTVAGTINGSTTLKLFLASTI